MPSPVKPSSTSSSSSMQGSNGDVEPNAIAPTSHLLAQATPNRRSLTLPIASQASAPSPLTRPTRPARLRSRTSYYASDLAPVMSRENSSEDMETQHHTQYPTEVMDHLSKSLEAGPSRSLHHEPPKSHTIIGRRASKSISGTRPSLIVTPAKQSQSYYTPQVTSPAYLASPSSPEVDIHRAVKRRTSTPTLVRRNTIREDTVGNVDQPVDPIAGPSKGKGRAVESRARSTSTSVVTAQNRDLTEEPVHLLGPSPSSAPVPSFAYQSSNSLTSPPPLWSGVTVTPATPSDLLATRTEEDLPSSWLTSVYNVGETALIRLADWARPQQHRYHASRRGSDEDSEKGLNGSEDETVESESRESQDGQSRGGRYWGLWGPGEQDGDEAEYFNRSLTQSANYPNQSKFEDALRQNGYVAASLPTPALSTKSLSRESSKRIKLRRPFRTHTTVEGDAQDGWLKTLLGVWAGSGGGKTGEVLRELGWTVGGLVGTFFVTLALVLWLISGLPITTLKHIPQSTTDLQLLSAEIRSYMSSSETGWWHTVGVIVIVGCWKHAWSVPGAVVLNILVGSLLDPMPALGLLTLITASGSLGAYLLSRPLAPLIAVLFPKPLALVRAALAPDSVPDPSSATGIEGETVTPIQASSDPAATPIGGPQEKANVWRRLLIMRAMGFVPWSGMNVACGVVGVDWKVFWLTTAAGSASWSYVTASVGNIISRLAVPSAALAASAVSGDTGEEILHGESLTSLLRDPVLIAKLVFLSALTLLPVILKRKSTGLTSQTVTPRSSSFEMDIQGTKPLPPAISALRLELDTASPPMSPLSQSLATFAPTPRAFDLLSFGRTAFRQGGRVVSSGVRGTVGAVGRLIKG